MLIGLQDKEKRFRSRVQKYSNSTSVSGYVSKVKCGLSKNHADFEKFPQEPLFEPKEEVYVEANGRTEGPYIVESVSLDCKYTLKLKSDGTIRRNVLEKDLRELDK